MLVKDELAKPLDEKIFLAKQVITKHIWEFGEGDVFIAWSGGKDSTFLLSLIRQVSVNIPVVFSNTGVEYPETVKFVRDLAKEWRLEFIELHPELTFWECVERWGFPPPSRFNTGDKYRGTPRCCYHLKEKPIIELIKQRHFKGNFVAVTAWESWGRRISAGRLGLCHFSKVYGLCRVRPILFFRPDEIWYLTHKWQIPVNPIYEKLPRCGCMPCTGHIGWEGQLARTNPKLYEFIQQKRGGEYQMAFSDLAITSLK